MPGLKNGAVTAHHARYIIDQRLADTVLAARVLGGGEDEGQGRRGALRSVRLGGRIRARRVHQPRPVSPDECLAGLPQKLLPAGTVFIFPT